MLVFCQSGKTISFNMKFVIYLAHMASVHYFYNPFRTSIISLIACKCIGLEGNLLFRRQKFDKTICFFSLSYEENRFIYIECKNDYITFGIITSDFVISLHSLIECAELAEFIAFSLVPFKCGSCADKRTI